MGVPPESGGSGIVSCATDPVNASFWVEPGRTRGAPCQRPVPRAQPSAAAASPAARLRATLETAVAVSPSSVSRTVSYPNVEKVVSAPQKPVPTRVVTQPVSEATTTPRTKEPTTFTVQVPQGDLVACRRCTARSVR